MKSSKEIITELVDIVGEAMSAQGGTSVVMMRPAMNMVKLKLSNLSENDSQDIIDKVHWLSHHIEKESGQLSPYHGIEDEYDPNPRTHTVSADGTVASKI